MRAEKLLLARSLWQKTRMASFRHPIQVILAIDLTA